MPACCWWWGMTISTRLLASLTLYIIIIPNDTTNSYLASYSKQPYISVLDELSHGVATNIPNS